MKTAKVLASRWSFKKAEMLSAIAHRKQGSDHHAQSLHLVEVLRPQALACRVGGRNIDTCKIITENKIATFHYGSCTLNDLFKNIVNVVNIYCFHWKKKYKYFIISLYKYFTYFIMKINKMFFD